MKKKLVIGGVVLAVVAAAVAFYATPYIALYSIHRAVERGDAEAVSRYVDFPVLREDIRATVLAQMEAVTAAQPGGGALAGLGQRMANTMANQMVDRMVSPEGVMLLMDGGALAQLQQMPQLQQRLPNPQVAPPAAPSEAPVAPLPSVAPPAAPSTAPSAAPEPSAPPAGRLNDLARLRESTDVRVTYQNWSRVRVGSQNAPGGLIFRRDGLFGWKLVAVEMPEPARL